MNATFTASDAVELAVLERNGFIESRHIGSAVVMAADGSVVTELGDITTPIFPRSTLKPFQAVAAMQSGVPLRGPQVALAAASHVGSREHTDVVRGMLAAAGVTEEHLQCPADWPQDTEARNELIRGGKGPQRIAFNCSGKHAAFLWACTENNWDHATYLDPRHPLQRRIAEVIEEFTGETVKHWAVDGCGAPLAAVSLTGLARGIGRLSKAPSGKHGNARAATVATAMLDYPWAVHGHGRENSIVMEDLGIIAKNGAEGVLVLGTDTGVSVALKMLDGNTRAASLVGLTLLAASGAVDPVAVEKVLDKIMQPVLGGGVPVGSLRLGAPVTALLG
ncbi:MULTISPECIES: asparaginase [unclassified Arthrobacter]|uniref:asparaginase n=1 Tax=unclassified Arthrobacter TaxID=235627 RepID=UPI001E3F4151|nr:MULTISPECIES: asparaginase [unclassified Arthrobacter]MCC9144693.1 asparaginase [Arthrobacter sp. zg-Y919]MDK1275919.1 asparaginase [Arthrobacter sp. zg.Y919]WIB02726.1 asparaginase [Arthrobacter sp. zg-Y919]